MLLWRTGELPPAKAAFQLAAILVMPSAAYTGVVESKPWLVGKSLRGVPQ